MPDIRRNILWGVFLVSLFLLWDAWNKHNGQTSFFDPPAARAPAAAGSAPQTVAANGLPASVAAGAAVPGAAASAAAPLVSEKVTITTDVVKATLDGKGGELVRLELLKYAESEDTKRNVVLMDRQPQSVYLAQTGLIDAQAGVALPNHTTVMTLVPGERELKDGAKELQVRFESPEIGGVQLIKTYTFRRGDYAVAVKHELRNAGAAPVQAKLYLQLARDGTVLGNTNVMAGPVSFTGPAVYSEQGKFEKVEFAAIDKGKAEYHKGSDSGWVAMVQHYFASAWLFNDKGAREFKIDTIPPNEATFGKSLYRVAMVLPLPSAAPGATVAHQATLFAGPQEEKKLEALAPGLDLVKDYGFLTMLSKPLFWLLDKLHGLIGNWGWAIVALVVLLKIAFYWLNASAYRSMAKMKAINPKVMEMRERLKDKPQQMQQEMMRIYREEKVNPFGGCLPIFVQMPFFIALYWVLLSTVEMRNAPWIGWITDLSTKDPFFILPLLMTLSTLFQTWLNPTPPDPVQAKMMWIMPLIFSVFFFFFPAGLVLYWLTNNVLGIAQQWFINKQLGLNTGK
ncbi:membrane protein insertase YidC [Aquabacterium sp. OR-4]|uniref:membrane protein insertase YidC n=1 Tax=Aquabacterium sp. OR-4 TaxID=2978127 RepID=UPI0028C99E1C|nr:membrane protein insertase YidC [Aquabacterium sp. OR-4]MDT7833760.1 membrane protein insertase YidC [Aquabacterium sp. OR-4]